MELNRINEILAQLAAEPKNGREHILSLSRALIEWMGYEWVENDRPRLLDFKTLKLKEVLAPAPITGQEQIYRLTAEGQDVKIRLAVLKKFDKKIIQYIVDNHVGMISFQSPIGGVRNYHGQGPTITKYPYFVHFITTAKYDRLWVIFNIGEQKRVLVFRNRLSQTQYNKILPVWHNISAKSKPEMAKLFWSILDVKEVNKDFYKLIKEQFDSLIGIAKLQAADFDENMTKQFAVRLIGRYIFCWFLKEKEVIPEALISSKTILKYKDTYFQTLLAKLYFKTLNAEVTDPARSENITELDELYRNIPYLNGGLFDWHPEDVLFEKLDLNDWLIAFVKVLEDFDFTVDESSSLYQQVAVDPEMLGRIFENLLASQNPDTEKMANQRKAFGAFYTPREIVDYMVNESLKAYLETHIMPSLPEQAMVVNEPLAEYKGTLFQAMEPQQPLITLSDKSIVADIERRRERVKEHIEKLFASGCTDNPFDKEETIKARKALSEITVFDPACGSGAFPMGVMLRLMELRQIVGHGHRNSYDLKEEILSRNIFGVDIMPMAVEISRLRAWLSLVLEADYRPADRKNNFGIAALPNLDFKFVCANSLIDSGYDAFLENVHHNATLYRLDGEIQKLETIRNNYFDPHGDKARKTELQADFLKTKNYVKTEFESLKKSWNLADFLNKVDDWNPFDDSHPSSFFSPAWMFGIRDGFDVVIGNPPYVQLQKGIFSKLTFPYSEGKDKGKQNLYKVFVEASYNFLKSNGTACMIVQSSLLCDLSSTYTRELLLSNSEIKKVVEYPKNTKNTDAQVFDSVLQGTCTYVFSKQKPLKEHSISISVNNDTSTIANLKFEDINQLSILTLYPEAYYIPLIVVGDSLVLEKISRNAIAFKFYIKSISQGDLNLTTSSERFSSSNTSIKLYRGRNIHKYKLLKSVEEYIELDFRKDKVDENAKSTFIVMQEITGTTDKYRLHACLTDKNERFLFGHTANKILLNDETLNNICLALLNSKFFDWFFRKTSTNNHVMGYEIEQLPFPKELKTKHESISVIVNQILSAKSQNLDTATLEKEIDVLVYKLYGLSYDEVKVVDPGFWMSAEEYENVKVE